MSLSLERQAKLWGSRVAVVDGNTAVSYDLLARRVESTANRLAEFGIGPGDRVAVISRNRLESVVLLFATWRVGGMFAPVSHRLTPATVSRPVEEIDPDLLLYESAQRDLVRQFDAQSFDEFEHDESSSVESADEWTTAFDQRDTCLLVHTDDGRRIVRLSRRAIEWTCIVAISGWGLGRTDCTIILLPLSVSHCLLRFALPLLMVGGRLVLQRAFDPERAMAAIEEHDVTCFGAGPTELRELVDAHAGTNRPSITSLDSIDWIATRARVPPDVREGFPVPLVRVYGRPETGPNVLRETPDGGQVAHPFPNCEVRTEDETGELFVRSPTTANGYLGGERFGEWVSTGDLFRRDDEGYAFVGRASEPFESEGEQVHPRAVETVLESHPDVRAAGVIEAVEETGGVAPKAVVVGDVSPGELREFAEERLEPYEVPRAIEMVSSLPRRTTGELNRGELRKRFGG
ncbi:class I adenylate-forming enzyme family protein [Haladaptatus caseinilyticus]|uniref:class I adenylate-forming enzyme family protein n=1 Tax=Haladaptatus caseinilyticus TaxID=2993314 RepID=UPI00224B70F1|nr:class I adenylate-forming enzyme family protein [Haladaptatus caseinilyticus]